MLDRVHYQYYNRRYGADGLHVAVDWARYEVLLLPEPEPLNPNMYSPCNPLCSLCCSQETMNRFRDEYIWPRIVRTEIEQRPYSLLLLIKAPAHILLLLLHCAAVTQLFALVLIDSTSLFFPLHLASGTGYKTSISSRTPRGCRRPLRARRS